jgi:hypothetical protein
MCPAITSSLPQGVRYMAANSGYDDHKLYNLSKRQEYTITLQRQITVDTFSESELGQAIYSWGSISVEPVNRTHQRRLQV